MSGRFGAHVEMVEVEELSGLRREVTAVEIAGKVRQFREFFAVGEDCSEGKLERAGRTAVAFDRLVQDKALDMLTYYASGAGVAENEDTMSSVIPGASMLTGQGVPVVGEYELKNVLAMKILDELGARDRLRSFMGWIVRRMWC